jgi:flagellar basal body-associated protein FliL
MDLEGKSSFFVLLFIVAFLSLALAILAGYVFFFSGNGNKTEVVTVRTEVPSEDDLGSMLLFEGKKIFNLKTSSVQGEATKSIPVVQVSVELKYFKKVKGIKNVPEKITPHLSEINELVGNYFLNITLEEVSQGTAKEKAKKELTKQINDILKAAGNGKNDIIYTVIFGEWFFQ